MEFVFVVRRSDLFEGHSVPHGFVPAALGPGWPQRILDLGFFVERAVAEHEPRWKQIIPYNIVLHGDRVVLLRRGGRIREERLRARLSIGVGGHVNPPDALGDGGRTAVVRVASERELREEIVTAGGHRVETLGFVNDDSNAVGAVHFGVVQAVRLSRPEVEVREADTLEGGLIPWQDLVARFRDRREQFETWSALLLDHWLETGIESVAIAATGARAQDGGGGAGSMSP